MNSEPRSVSPSANILGEMSLVYRNGGEYTTSSKTNTCPWNKFLLSLARFTAKRPLESTFPDHPEGGGVGPFSQWEQLEIQNGVERTGRNCVSKSIV